MHTLRTKRLNALRDFEFAKYGGGVGHWVRAAEACRGGKGSIPNAHGEVNATFSFFTLYSFF